MVPIIGHLVKELLKLYSEPIYSMSWDPFMAIESGSTRSSEVDREYKKSSFYLLLMLR